MSSLKSMLPTADFSTGKIFADRLDLDRGHLLVIELHALDAGPGFHCRRIASLGVRIGARRLEP